MIVNLEGLPEATYLAYDRVRSQRPIRHYYQLAGYPGLILVTQGLGFHLATLAAMQAENGPLVARIDGASANNPERWRAFLFKLAGRQLELPDIHCKVTLFRPSEPRPAEPVAIGPWLAVEYARVIEEAHDPVQLQALRAQLRALEGD